MSNELQDQVQKIIEGSLAGEDARLVLQNAALELYQAQQAVERKARALQRAEESLLYGPGVKRADRKAQFDDFMRPMCGIIRPPAA